MHDEVGVAVDVDGLGEGSVILYGNTADWID